MLKRWKWIKKKITCFKNPTNREKSHCHIFHPWCIKTELEKGRVLDGTCIIPGCTPVSLPENKIALYKEYIPKLGFDIGGVIIDRTKNDELGISFLTDNYLNGLVVPNAFEILAVLINIFGKDNTYIVSGKTMKEKKLKWLNHNEFFIKTGFKKENTYFCYRRGEKVHVIKQLGKFLVN